MDIIQSEQQKEKQFFFKWSNLRDLCNNIKRFNICIVGIPGEEERDKRIKHTSEQHSDPNLQKTAGRALKGSFIEI